MDFEQLSKLARVLALVKVSEYEGTHNGAPVKLKLSPLAFMEPPPAPAKKTTEEAPKEASEMDDLLYSVEG